MINKWTSVCLRTLSPRRCLHIALMMVCTSGIVSMGALAQQATRVDSGRYSLKMLVLGALGHRPTTAIAYHEAQKKGNDFQIAKSEWYPTLDYSLSSQNIRKESESGLEQNIENKISLSQRITDFGGRLARVRKAEYEKQGADIDFEKNMLSVAQQVSEVYLNINKNREILDSITLEKGFYKEMLDNFSLLVSSRVTTQSDLRKVQASIDALNTREITYKSILDTDLFKLSNMVGQPLAIERLESQTEIFLNYVFIDSAEKILREVMNANYDYQMLVKAREAAYQETKSVKSTYFPSVDLSGSYVNNHPSSNADPSDYENEFRVDVSLNLNLFSGFRNSEEDRKAASSYVQEKLRIEEFILNSRENINNMVAKYNAANETNEVAKRSYDNAIKLSELYSQEFQLGQRSLLDLISSRNEAFQAHTNMIESQYASHSAKLEQLVLISSLNNFIGLSNLKNTYRYEPQTE